MKKLLLCLVALLATIGAQASTETISKGKGTSSTSTVKFSATDKPDITAKAVYKLTLNADNTLNVEVTFENLNSDIPGLIDAGYMWIDNETTLTLSDGKYTGKTATAVEPGKSYSNCYFKRICANEQNGYGEAGQLIFPFEFIAPSAATESEISGVVSDITATTATLTLTCKPAEGKTVEKIVVSGLGEGNDITFTSTDNLTANLTDLTPGTTYDLTFTLTCTDNSTATSTFQFTTLTAPKEVSMEFIPVNVSDLSALFKLKVDLSDNDQSKEFIHMYLRKDDGTDVNPADPDTYGEAKGTPAVDPRWKRMTIENPVFFNYTELEKNTDYIAIAVVKKDGYTGFAQTKFKTLDKADNTTSYIENGYFQDGENVLTELPDGTKKRLVYLASVRYTFTYDEEHGELYLTFDTRIRNDHKLPVLQSKYILKVDGRNDPYYGNPTNTTGYKDHYSFVINNQCEDIATLISNKTPLHFTYFTDYENGGQSYFNGFDYDGSTSSDDFGDPADIQWIAYSYKDQQEQNKNRYDLYKLLPKTQLMATVVDADGHYLPRKIVKFEMATNDSGKATVTCDTSLGQPKWFVEATSLADATNTEVDFEVVAYHELETADSPAAAPRRILNADKNRLEAKRGFHYIESETPTGIDDIEADDANAPVRYFDLNGREISEPQKGMFVIRLQGSKATKMIAE